VGYGFGGVVDQVWQQFQAQTLVLLPKVMGSGLVLVLGVLFAAVVGRVSAWVLRSAQVDRRAARLGLSTPLETIGVGSSASALVRLIQAAILFSTSILALYWVDPRLASDLAERFLLYVPHLVVGGIILAAGVVLSKLAGRSVLIAAVNADLPSARLISSLTTGAVVLTSVAIALEQLGIGRITVLIAFSTLFGGVTLAGAIAFGLGAHDLVREWMAGRAAPPAHPREPETISHW
jgi:hypothetical protein